MRGRSNEVRKRGNLYLTLAEVLRISPRARKGPMELLGKSKEELREICVALGELAFRGAQIYHALYSEGKFDVAQITNLPAALRERLDRKSVV